jgi:hypothetical protein
VKELELNGQFRKRKKSLQATIKTWQGKCKTLSDEKRALKDEIQQQWVGMVAYSIIRGYPCNEAVGTQTRIKKKARNIGSLKLSCYVVVIMICYRKPYSHIIVLIADKYPFLPPGENRELLEKAEHYFRTFIHVTRDGMDMSGIPRQCLTEINGEHSLKRKYEVALDKVAYVRDAVTNKRCKAMSRIKEVCTSTYRVYKVFIKPKQPA